MKSDRKEFVRTQQHRNARMAVGASAARGRGNKGVVSHAREFMRRVDLARFATSARRQFEQTLDSETDKLVAKLPKSASSWGLSRKLLNIFLRECLYNGYLNEAYGLGRAEALLEIPLDSITARRLREAQPDLPRWLGVRGLSPEVSALYQTAAHDIATKRRTARVHLDAYWWGVRE